MMPSGRWYRGLLRAGRPSTSSTTGRTWPWCSIPAGRSSSASFTGPAVDQILATEEVTPLSPGSVQSAGTVNWDLTDNQGTVRDVVAVQRARRRRAWSITSFTTPSGRSLRRPSALSADVHVRRHVAGSRRPGSITTTPAGTMPWMASSPARTRWASAGGQTNTSEYCGNSPTNGTDPTGEFGWGLATTIGGALIGGATNGLIYAFAAQDNATPGGFWGAVAGGAVAGAMVWRGLVARDSRHRRGLLRHRGRHRRVCCWLHAVSRPAEHRPPEASY